MLKTIVEIFHLLLVMVEKIISSLDKLDSLGNNLDFGVLSLPEDFVKVL